MTTPPSSTATEPTRLYWPAAWEQNREAVLARLSRTEKWTITECAFFLRCSWQHISNLMAVRRIKWINIAAVPGSRPLYRIYRDSVLAFEQSGLEGAEK